jgi:hypothetical protein
VWRVDLPFNTNHCNNCNNNCNNNTLAFAEKLSRVAAPAHADAQRAVDAAVRRECAWLSDPLVRELIGRVDDTFLPIKRRRARRPVPQAVALEPHRAVALRGVTAEQIAAEERQFEPQLE